MNIDQEVIFTKPEPNRTLPWSKDEYMIVNGYQLVYTAHRKKPEIVVRMFGGSRSSPELLRAQGFRVVMPKTIRIASAS